MEAYVSVTGECIMPEGKIQVHYPAIWFVTETGKWIMPEESPSALSSYSVRNSDTSPQTSDKSLSKHPTNLIKTVICDKES